MWADMDSDSDEDLRLKRLMEEMTEGQREQILKYLITCAAFDRYDEMRH